MVDFHFNFSNQELAAANIVVAAFLASTGYSHPGHNTGEAQPPWAWTFVADLTCEGYTRDDAEILLNALVDKGFLTYHKPNCYMLTWAGWAWAGKQWRDAQ